MENEDKNTQNTNETEDTSTSNNETSKDNKEVTFSNEQQAKIDELIKQNTAKYKNQIEQEKNSKQEDIQKAIDDYAKKQNMTEKERSESELKDMKAKLELYKQKEAQRERLDDARKIVSERNLPSFFAEKFVGADEDETSTNIDTAEKEWNKSVHEQVLKLTQGTLTPKAPTGGKTEPSHKDLSQMSYKELTELKEKDPDQFSQIMQGK